MVIYTENVLKKFGNDFETVKNKIIQAVTLLDNAFY